jgi:hypothetical protein
MALQGQLVLLVHHLAQLKKHPLAKYRLLLAQTDSLLLY